jgi:multidrug efflux pump subunit AcrA (membrane-fusion protein)
MFIEEGHAMKRTIPVILTMIIVLTACGGTAGGGNNAAPTVTPIPTAPAAALPTYTVQRGTVEEDLVFSGRWLPRDQTTLAFEVAGTVRGVYVQGGDTVTTGELLADFDTSDLENQLSNAKLSLNSAINKLQTGSTGSVQTVLNAQVSLANSRLSLESAQQNSPWTSLDNARIGLQQAQNTLDDAQRAYDDAISHPDSAASSVDSAYQRLRDAQIGLRTAQNAYYSAAQNFNAHTISVEQQQNAVVQNEMALQQALAGTGVDPDLLNAVQSAQLNVDQIQAKIDKSTLHSTLDGIVLEVTIKPGDNAAAFAPVITLAQPEPKEAVANLAFNDTQSLSVGMVGVCEVMNQPETAVQCVVRHIPLSSRDADQTVRVAATLQNLALGQLVQVTMPLQVRENVLWLPPAAIRTFQSRTFVVIQTPEGERVADVTLGLQTTDRVEIQSGVQEGDVVVGP